MKLYIAFTGLMMILQPEAQGPAEILFLNGENRQVEWQEETIEVLDHVLRVDLNAASDSHQTIYLSEDVEMGVDDPAAVGGVTRVRDAAFLSFSEIYAHAPHCAPKLAMSCQGPLALQTCHDQGTRLLAGRFHLRGGTLQPAEVKEEAIVTADLAALPAPTKDNPLEVRPPERELWKVCPVSQPDCDNSPVAQTTFDGVLYTLELPAGSETVSIVLGDHRLEIPIVEQMACDAIDGHAAGKPCGYLEITNGFTAPRGHHPMVKAADFHFLLNYELFDELPQGCEAMVPVWDHYGTGTEPGGGTRCIPPSQP